MARNANKNEFQTSKMATGGHFEKKMKVAFTSKMVRNANKNEFQMSKMTAPHIMKKKMKVTF